MSILMYGVRSWTSIRAVEILPVHELIAISLIWSFTQVSDQLKRAAKVAVNLQTRRDERVDCMAIPYKQCFDSILI